MKACNGLLVPSTSVLRFMRCQLQSEHGITHLSIPRSAPSAKVSLSRHCRALSTAKPSFTCLFRRPSNHDRQARNGQRAFSASTSPSFSSSQHALATRRALSTSSTLREAFWRRLRPTPRSSPRADAEYSGDRPPIESFLDEHGGLGGRIIKPSNELKLRCTEFDENGNVTLVNGEFKKSELIAKYSMLPRDLRKIDSSVLPHILVRPSAILMNLLHIHCLIKHNRVLVFDVYGSTDSYAQSLFMYDLEGKLRQKQTSAAAGGLPYEFRALEAVLISVTSGLESEFEGVREPVVRVLRDLEEDIDRDKLRHLLIFSKKLSTFEQKARLVRDAIDDLLEADDDLAAMYLTEKAAGKEREEDNHEEVELLLESYHKVADEIVQVSSNLVSSIKNTEEIIRAILDANRNALMLLDLKFSILTLGTTIGMFIAALYGMNLENFIEESHYGFFGISGMCVVLTGIASIWGLRRLRKVQRVRMWGEGGSFARTKMTGRQPGRGSWQELDGAPKVEDIKEQWLSHERQDRGLGETVAGIRQGERLRTWREEQIKRMKMREAQREVEALPPVPVGT